MYPTPGWHYAHFETGYNDSKISADVVTSLSVRETHRAKRNDGYFGFLHLKLSPHIDNSYVLILSVFRSHYSTL